MQNNSLKVSWIWYYEKSAYMASRPSHSDWERAPSFFCLLNINKEWLIPTDDMNIMVWPHWWASLRATRFGVRRVGLLERCPYICRFVLRGRKQMGYLPKLSTVHSSRQTSNILPFQMVLRCFEMFECFILRLTSKTEVLQTPSALEFGNLEFFGKIWNFWRIWNSWGFFRIF